MKLAVNPRNYRIWLLACSSSWLLTSPSFAFPPPYWWESPTADRVKVVCGEQSLTTLIPQLMLDLPGYTNRIIQRSRDRHQKVDLYPYLIAAGKPEFQPLPLNQFGSPSEYASPGVEQVFFTTLERQYLNQRAMELQQFHWLFLTKAKTGWRFVMMFSQIGNYPIKKSEGTKKVLMVSQRVESSDSAVGLGIKDWLRDCEERGEERAGDAGGEVIFETK